MKTNIFAKHNVLVEKPTLKCSHGKVYLWMTSLTKMERRDETSHFKFNYFLG